MGSLQLAQEIGHSNIITTDMGGTSFDVALVVDGKPLVSGTHEVGGYHLNTPVIDIRAIGAGGGSIARVQGGLLRARKAPVPRPVRSATAAAASSPPSPMRTWSSASLTRTISSADA